MTDLIVRRSSVLKQYAPLYFNCSECGKPILHGWERRTGYCDACRSQLLEEGRLPAHVAVLEGQAAVRAMAVAKRDHAQRHAGKARGTWSTTS